MKDLIIDWIENHTLEDERGWCFDDGDGIPLTPFYTTEAELHDKQYDFAMTHAMDALADMADTVNDMLEDR